MKELEPIAPCPICGGLMSLKEEHLAQNLSQMELMSGEQPKLYGEGKLVYVCSKCGYKHYVKK